MNFKLKTTLPLLVGSTLGVQTAFALNTQTDDVVVRASRTPVSLHQVGSSVTILNSDQLQKRQSVPVSEILREVPGLAVSRNGVLGSSTQIRVRGAEANQLMVLIDGVEVNDLAQDSGFNFAHLLSHDIERIEVIRGPQSALWGSDALAGVINIITKTGEAPFNATGFAEAGSFGTEHVGGTLSGQDDRYYYKLSASYLDSEGDNISRSGSEDDGYDNTTLGIAAGFAPLDNLQFDLTGRQIKADNQFDETSVTTGLQSDSDRNSESTQNYGRVQSKLSLWDGKWEQTLGMAVTNTDNDNFESGIQTSSTQGNKNHYDYQSSFFFDTPNFAEANHILTLAVDHEKETYTQRGTATLFGDPNQDLEAKNTGYVIEWRGELWQRLQLSASARKDDNNAFKDKTTHRFTAAYLFPETGTRLRAAYGTGIKNPTFTERFGFFTSSSSSFVGNADLKPEESKSWEAGIEQQFWGDKASLSLTYFNEELKDEINGFVFDAGLGAFTAMNVEGESERQGAEVSAQVQLTEQLTVSAAYTYLDATQPEGDRQVDEVRRPRHTGNVNVNYTFPDEKLNLNLSVNYNGEQYDTFFPPFPQPSQRVTLDDFTLVTLAGSYALSEQISLYARVENLLDETYEEVFSFRAPGRGAYAGIRVNF